MIEKAKHRAVSGLIVGGKDCAELLAAREDLFDTGQAGCLGKLPLDDQALIDGEASLGQRTLIAHQAIGRVGVIARSGDVRNARVAEADQAAGRAVGTGLIVDIDIAMMI